LVGIESDQLVFDYLSRIGDLAHRTSMTAAERARLVTGLRGEIDRLRAEEGGAESKAAVRKILARLGKPEEIVAGAGGGTGTGLPAPRDGAGDDRFDEDTKVSLWKRAGSAGRSSGGESPPPTASAGASAPHLAGMDELGPEESNPDWWRVDPSPYGDGGGSRNLGEPVPGFVGGIEVPELFKPPQSETKPEPTVPAETGPRAAERANEPTADAGTGEGTEAVAEGRSGWRRLIPGGLPGGAKSGAATGPRVGGVVEWAAAVLLVSGVVIGSLLPLAVGWLAAWWSPRLSRMEGKWAAAGVPGVVVGGAIVWLWGRVDGRWGDPIEKGGKGLEQALLQTGPAVLKIAAIASALYLVWRARRPRA
jgi:hypothetical protein